MLSREHWWIVIDPDGGLEGRWRPLPAGPIKPGTREIEVVPAVRPDATLTGRYTRTHLALRTVSTEYDLGMLAVRLLLALAERGGGASTADLIEDTARSRDNASGGHVRRELASLSRQGYVTPQAARGGAPTPGTMSVWRLTGDGRRVAERVRQLATEGDAT